MLMMMMLVAYVCFQIRLMNFKFVTDCGVLNQQNNSGFQLPERDSQHLTSLTRLVEMCI